MIGRMASASAAARFAPNPRRSMHERTMESTNSLHLARRMGSLEPSATLAMAARASAMIASGLDVIDLSVG